MQTDSNLLWTAFDADTSQQRILYEWCITFLYEFIGEGEPFKCCDHLLCQLCRKYFTTHTSLHAHIALQHGRALIKCSKCNANSRSNICHLCGEFVMKLNEHESMHYRDKEGINAFFECSKCYKSFCRFNELKQHLVESHGEGRAVSKAVKCMVCPMKFYSRHVRDQHFVLHFKTVFEKLWQNICTMHEKFGALLQSNECPLCKNIMTTKRGLRRHVINRHLLQSFGSSEILVDELTIATKCEESEAIPEVLNAIDGIKTETVNEGDKQLNGMIEPDENPLKEVKYGMAKANEESLMEHNELNEDALERDSSIAMKDQYVERGKTTTLENGYQNKVAALTADQRSQRDTDSRKESIEDVQPSEHHQIGLNKNLSSRHSVVFPQSRNNYGMYRSSLNESSIDTMLSLNSGQADSERRDNDIRKIGMLADPSSSVASDMRVRLVELCLDRNALSPRCVRCKTTFARMFDFEIHLIRTHISSLF